MSTSRYQTGSYQPLDYGASSTLAAERADDFWADVPASGSRSGASTVPAAAGFRRKPTDPLERAKRLMRGRVALAIALALAGALIGAAFGYHTRNPTYAASGTIKVNPSVPTVAAGNRNWPGYQSWMRTETRRIENDTGIAQAALDTEVWQDTGAKVGVEQFKNWIDAQRSDGDYFISVGVQTYDPDLAEAGVRAVLEAYAQDFRERKAALEKTVSGAGEVIRTQTDKELADIEGEIRELASTYAGAEDLSGEFNRVRSTLQAAEQDLTAIQRDLQRARDVQARVNDLPITALAEGDLELSRLLDKRNALQQELTQMQTRGLASRSPAVVNASASLALLDEQIEEQASRARERYFGRMPNLNGNGDYIAVTLDYINQLMARQEELERRVAELRPEVGRVAQDANRMERLVERRDELAQSISQLARAIDQEQKDAQIEDLIGWLELYYPSEGSAFISKDGRNAMALGGAILGGGIPLALVVLLGLLDKRFRYSDDAADLAGETPGPAGGPAPLLGILPNLPDRLSDPNQASIAAHCVHQIRSILQIHHATPIPGAENGAEQPQAFAITSAARGDGKTSLALALGLSYAASGCRTLLVDTDLQHGGLSTRLGVSGDEGIMDALGGGDLLDAVCETDVANLAILPIGRAQGNQAGAFSPAAVRQLIAHAKRHFDVVLCDTGPVMGSIESTPVVAAMDATIVCVSRGQNRPMVEKALRHLEHVGATVAGLVFNRAQPADFERSVAGMNFRQSPRLPMRPALANHANGNGNGNGQSSNGSAAN